MRESQTISTPVPLRPRAAWLGPTLLLAVAACEPSSVMDIEPSLSRTSPAVSFEDLGFLPGGRERATLFAINDPGQMAGRASTATTSVAVLVGVGGDFTALSSMNSRAMAINNRGWTAGLFASPNDGAHAFVHEGDDLVDIGPGHATALNNRGEVVGQSWVGLPRAFVYRDGVMEHLTDHLSGATDINARGQIVGSHVSPVSGEWTPFLWEAGQLTDLPVNGGNLSASAISDGGVVVGYGLDADGEWVVARWEDGTLETSAAPSNWRTEVTAANNRGEIVGTTRPGGSCCQAVAWVGGQMIELPDPYGLWSRAYDINDRGEIVGTVRTPTGDHAARWVLR